MASGAAGTGNGTAVACANCEAGSKFSYWCIAAAARAAAFLYSSCRGFQENGARGWLAVYGALPRGVSGRAYSVDG